MVRSFLIRSMTGEEVYPNKLELVNCTGKGAWFSIHVEGKKTVIMLVTAEGASEINAMDEPERYANDAVD